MLDFDPHILPSRYLTADIPGTGGVLKLRDEDFIVEELPAYHPSGEGEHLYLWVQKRHMSTMHVARLLADHFKVRRDAVGLAGLKDKVAITTQMISIHLPRKDAAFGAFEHENIQILWTDRHINKLRRGHLAGNRFIIRIRDTTAAKVVHAKKALTALARLGVPNRIGSQRFGNLASNHLVGRALLLGDARGAIDTLLGPSPLAHANQTDARRLFAEGKFDDALAAFPPGCHTERRVLSTLARGGTPEQAIRSIERIDFGFFITAFQSAIFNALLDARIESGRLASLGEGDLAFKHDSGAVFPISSDMPVEEQAALDARLQALEISPSGPMWGSGMTRASGSVGAAELAALEATGVTDARLASMSRRDLETMVGQRRPMRVPLKLPDIEAGIDEHGDYIKCTFELPRGAFATTAMQEIMKTDPATLSDDAED